MSKRVRISNDSLNSYGTRVLTSGMSTEQYCRNPVLLYMHERGSVIGYMKDLKTEDGEVTGEPVFDCATELSRRCRKQWEFGSLKMVSAGLDILELSEDPSLLVQGQTSPTVTKSRLFEVSIVDIGANDDAIVLKRDGMTITLGRDGACPLPGLSTNNNQKQESEMETKTIALQLGLQETATEAEITARIAELNASKQEADQLKKDKEALTLARITSLVETAIGEKRLGAEKKQQFIDLGKKVGADDLKATLEAMAPQVKLSSVITPSGGAPSGTAAYTKLSEVPPEKLLELRSQDPSEYKRLYKAEYGMECRM